MTVQVADVHAHVQRLVSVVKMVTALEEYSTEEQRCCAFLVGKRTHKGSS
jgi:hypothetical protein